jgi:hypothetical protein
MVLYTIENLLETIATPADQLGDSDVETSTAGDLE